MRKIFALLIIGLAIVSCLDEDILDQPTVSFYPTLAITANEGDERQYEVFMETSQEVTSIGTVVLNVSNAENLKTTPPIVGGKLSLSFDAESIMSFTIEALDDDLSSGYTSMFTVSSISGGIRSIGIREFSFNVIDNDQEPVFEDDFETANLNEWQTHRSGGSNNWEVRNFDENNYAIISNFNNTGDPLESWLISPTFDFDKLSSETLSFESQTAFNDGNLLEVVVISEYSSGNPSGTIVEVLTPTLDPHRGGGFGNFTFSEVLDLNGISGKGNIAFHYKAVDAADGSQWQIDNVILSASNPDGGGSNDNSFDLPFTDDLNTCGDFSIPANFIQERSPGSKKDRGWECSGSGESGSQGLRVTAAGGVTGTVDAWLISAKPFELGIVTSGILSFDAKSTEDGTGELKVLWSNNYLGSGDPTNAIWSEFTGVTLPTGGSKVYQNIEVDIKDATGALTYIAFQFVGGTNSSSISYDIDNINVASGSGGSGGSIDISTARDLDGQEVTISGIVTTPDFGFENDIYFVQDATGGIGILNNEDEGINIGDEVEITGTVGDFFGQIQITLSSIHVISMGNDLPSQIDITATDLAVGTPLQGSRVTLSGVTLDDASTWPTIAIDESSGLSVNATVGTTSFIIRIDRGESFYDGSTAPTGTFSVTGILTRFNDDVQMMPFLDGDIN